MIWESSKQRAEWEGTAGNTAMGSTRGQHGCWGEVTADSQLLQALKTCSGLPSPNPASLLTCTAAGCDDFHGGISHTWVSHSNGPSPHHPYTTSPLAAGILGTRRTVHQGVKHCKQQHSKPAPAGTRYQQQTETRGRIGYMLFWARHIL